jgi:tetratricopeptide (TPR) repeat protein
MTNQQYSEASKFGEAAGAAWHFCAGVIYLQRAGSTSGQEREGNLKRAVAEMRFTINKIEPHHPWYPEMHIDFARAHYTSGLKKEAFSILQRLITTHPTHSLPYTALAYYLKRENQLEQAIAVLQKAPELLLNESAELNYFLGWYLMEADDAEAAVSYAKRAYALNYPVPTLRQRLAAKGLSW